MEHLERETDEEPQNGGPGEPGFEMRAVGKGCPVLYWVKEPKAHPKAFSDGAVDLEETFPIVRSASSALLPSRLGDSIG